MNPYDDETEMILKMIEQYENADYEGSEETYNNLREAFGVERIMKQVWEQRPLGKATVEAGWYQNQKAELFHYDGVVWDVVPEEDPRELEFLS